jgi:hypothetical protein
MKSRREEPVFQPGGADRLLEGIGRDLTDDERALLLAVIGVDAEKLDEKGLAALEKLKEQVKDYDPEELAQAVSATFVEEVALRQENCSMSMRITNAASTSGDWRSGAASASTM